MFERWLLIFSDLLLSVVIAAFLLAGTAWIFPGFRDFLWRGF